LTSCFDTLAFDRHAEDVGDAAQEHDVALTELAFGAAIDLEHAERGAFSPEDDIHGAPNAVLDQQLGGAEPVLHLQVVRDHCLAGLESIARRGSRIGAHGRGADDAGVPPDAGADQEPVLPGHILEDLRKLGFEAGRCELRRLVEQLGKRRSFECQHAEVRQDLLLLDSQP
jgi:hypothetical protein